jgi:phage gp29-like protein
MPTPVTPAETDTITPTMPALPYIGPELGLADSRRHTPIGPQLTYNPDSLVGRKGLECYARMAREDPVIRACLSLRKHAILAPGWKLEPGDESDAAADLAALLTSDLEQLTIPFDQVVSELLSCFALGFSLGELLWSADGDRIRLCAVKPRSVLDFTFSQDEYGNIMSIVQQAGHTGLVRIPPSKMIHLAWNGDCSNPYGTSDLRAVYTTWFRREAFCQWFASASERLGSPVITATHPSNIGREGARLLLDCLTRLQANTALAIPDGTTLGLLESQRDIRSYFIDSINHFDMVIARALLVPDLSGFAGSKTAGGSYALGSTQQAAWFLSLDFMSSWLQAQLQQQLIERMCVWAAASDVRFTDRKVWPRCNLLPAERDTRTALTQSWLQLCQANAVTPTDADEEHVRQLLGFPSSTAGTPLPPRAAPSFGRSIVPGVTPAGEPVPFAEQGDDTIATPTPARRRLTRAEERADLPKLEAMMNRCGTRLRDVLAEGVSEMVADIKTKVPTIATMDEARAITVSPEVREGLRARVAEVLLDAHRQAKDRAREEVAKAKAHAIDSMVSACEMRAADKARKS